MSEKIPKYYYAFGFKLPVKFTREKGVRAKIKYEIRFNPTKKEYEFKPLTLFMNPDLPHTIRKKSIKHELAHLITEKKFVEKSLNLYVRKVGGRTVTREELRFLRWLFGAGHGSEFRKFARRLKASFNEIEI